MPDPVVLSTAWSAILPALLLGYAFGSLPFGLILTRLGGAGDVRSIGSGNIGATNVLRTGHKGLAGLTLLGDVLKGTIAVVVCAYLFPGTAVYAGVAAFLGHLFPVWLGFRGGKGVATYIGVLLGWYWPAAIAFCVIWLGVAAISRYSSMAGLLSSLAAPFVLVGFSLTAPAVAAGVMTVLLWLKHHQNIRRLIGGEESKIGAKK